MGYRYPHEEAEFLVAGAIAFVFAGLALPLAARLPSRAGVPLAALSFLLAVAIGIAFWFRTRR